MKGRKKAQAAQKGGEGALSLTAPFGPQRAREPVGRMLGKQASRPPVMCPVWQRQVRRRSARQPVRNSVRRYAQPLDLFGPARSTTFSGIGPGLSRRKARE